jgi:hypothetical protein
MRSPSLLGLAGAALIATAVSACGSSSPGLASQPASRIIARSQAAMNGLSSLHATGTGTFSGTSGRLDLYLTNHGGRGTIVAGDKTISLIDVGPHVYIRASQAFWSAQAGPSLGRRLGGRWLTASDTGQFAQLAQLLTLRPFVDKLLASHGSLTRGATTTIAGHRAIAIRDTTQGGVAYIAASGPPYVLEIVNQAKGQSIAFSGLNQPVSLAAPPGAVSVSSLLG